MMGRITSFGSLLSASLALACAPSTTGKAKQTLATMEQSLTQTIATLTAYSQSQQELIARHYRSIGKPEEGERALQEFQQARNQVAVAVVKASAILSAGRPLIALVELGSEKSIDLIAWLNEGLQALNAVRVAVNGLKSWTP